MLELRSTFVALAASGEVVAAVPGKKIQVYGVVLSALAASNVKFQSAATTDISMTYYLAATSGFVVPNTQYPRFQTAEGEALTLNMSAATNVGVEVIYGLV